MVAMFHSRRFLISLAAVAVVLTVALTVAFLAGPRSAITRENAAQIQKGMTLAQVEQMLGGPARDEESVPFIQAWGGNPPTAFWRSRDVLVLVWLDADGTVANCRIHEAESFLHATRRVLGL